MFAPFFWHRLDATGCHCLISRKFLIGRALSRLDKNGVFSTSPCKIARSYPDWWQAVKRAVYCRAHSLWVAMTDAGQCLARALQRTGKPVARGEEIVAGVFGSSGDFTQQLNQLSCLIFSQLAKDSCVLVFNFFTDLQHPFAAQGRGQDIDLSMITPRNLAVYQPV